MGLFGVKREREERRADGYIFLIGQGRLTS